MATPTWRKCWHDAMWLKPGAGFHSRTRWNDKHLTEFIWRVRGSTTSRSDREWQLTGDDFVTMNFALWPVASRNGRYLAVRAAVRFGNLKQARFVAPTNRRTATAV